MFTGIVEETGTVVRAEQTDDGFVLAIRAALTLEDSKPGDSIAVNGTCLTIVSITESDYGFGVAPETLSRTNLGALTAGAAVNLERSVTPATRMGGHFVQGHIDGTGTIVEFRPDAESVWLRIEVPREMMKWIVPKGFVTLDGISLTIVDVNETDFTVMLVPFTINHVAAALRHLGHVVNIEVDVLGKYVDRILEHRLAG